MTLIDHLKDRYGWMRGQYPTSINDIVQREPALAEPLEKVRIGRIKEAIGDASLIPLCVLMGIPEYGTFAFAAGLLTVGYNTMKGKGDAHKASIEFANANLEGTTESLKRDALKTLDRKAALLDLEERAIQAGNGIDRGAFYVTSAFAGTHAISAAYSGDLRDAAFTAAAILAYGTISILRKRGQLKEVRRKREVLRSEVDRRESEALRYAKDITPATPIEAVTP